ncbi:hypothetical protein [Couchioplanes azureus]|uniref:hypothetical protein n=1 Tax=Couchioplanes caeruleus TaxID=56438 RepID=UPI001E533A7E|nr:hypothetical protein [Couchioplanes caeruleus]
MACIDEFDRLRGRHVTSWSGVEMALRDEAPDGGGPQFEDPAISCLQMLIVGVGFGDGPLLTVHTYQDDDVCGLRMGANADYLSAEWTGIYRLRDLSMLPTGEIEEVSVVLDEGVVAEVVLRVRGRPVVLMAGEAYEVGGDRLRLVRLDESVLVFTDLAAVESVDWHPERRTAFPG